MRVAWVHPSWRDLVIEHLARDAAARGRYLRSSSVNGTLLALSSAGGRDGTRRLPLVRSDGDWDALGDRIYELAPELEAPELVGLCGAVARAVADLRQRPERAEADALARMLLSRTSALWAATDAPIALDELEAWFELSTLLSPRPPAPPLAVTWIELVPLVPPDLGDYQSLERFADWLGLAELVLGYDRTLLLELGLPDGPPQTITGFLADVAKDESRRRLRSVEQARRALEHIGRLFPSLAEHSRAWDDASWVLRRRDDPALAPAPSWTPGRPHPGHIDVRRVLRDL